MTNNTETLYNALDKIKELEKEKCELLGLIQGKDKLIEKMKCCGNCKLLCFDYADLFCTGKDEYIDANEVCDKWELAERWGF